MNLKITLVVFLVLSLALFAGLIMQQYRSRTQLAVAAGENLAALTQRYTQAGTIYDRNGVVLAKSEAGSRVYSDDANLAKAMLHAVGDYTHRIDNTIETRYQSVLLGSGRNPLRQFWLDIRGKGLYGDDIVLTLDSRLCMEAARQLQDRSGSIVLLNYETGAVLAMVSSPSTSPQSVIAYEGFPETSLFNRSLQGAYAPGSVFKLVTAMAWLQSDLYDEDFHLTCHGESTFHPDAANEDGDGHGAVTFKSAVARSCNVFFGELGVMLGQEALLEAAEQLGIGEAYRVDLLNGVRSEISTEDDDIMLSWLAIGQPTGDSTLRVSPMELARLTGAIAAGGVLKATHVVDHLIDPDDREYGTMRVTTERRIMSPTLAGALEELMIGVVESGSGTSAAVSGYQSAGKTGTVQVAGQENNALYVGYLIDSQTPLAIAIVVEEGGSGGRTAAPMASAMFRAAIDILQSDD